MRDRISTIEEGPQFIAIAKLHDLAAEQDLALAEEDRQRVEQTTREERRDRLAGSARTLADMFMSNLYESLDSVSGIQRSTQMNDVTFRFGQGTLLISPLESVREVPSNPFDVVAVFSISITQDRDQNGCNGRQHSLWFCDAEEEGSYHWYETAFHRLRGQRSNIEPYALTPLDRDAQLALSATIHTVQVARKFFRVSDEQADEFVNHWIEFLTQAAQGALYFPQILPEGERAVWRRK
ncbi:hypothetical protein [Rhodococcus tibetensis]|uniref:Uncharacterized protein n=1 Tax=Rhodococcus tibetensis TaxID=2965064 RepID=A0ABT1Q7B4_9NOCA|nr:hypothetical protein [Rhodococcus sp. FXJ9.536]MCQ4118143.1 hypothetical protein [Rhodococcus sp. FXJ9.536]